jgi:hypothetical protein
VDLSTVYVCGLGAVSPAGWSVAALRETLRANRPLPVEALLQPGITRPLRARPVPPPGSRPAFLAHPRLRRTSSLTQHAASTALEAVAGVSENGRPKGRLGLVACYQSGCVQYSCRFYEEVLNDPLTASPLVFPETVFAAPTSHIAALLGNTPMACTVVGDPSCFLQGVALAADWLADGRVDYCLVFGAEEYHWLSANALWHFEHSTIFCSGAAALCLTLDPGLSLGVALDRITDAQTYSGRQDRAGAARAMRAQLPTGAPDELLCSGLGNSRRTDAAEQAAWRDWPGRRLNPVPILGQGLMATAAWQCVAACDAVANRETPAATVSLVGCNQQAIGARFIRGAAPAV